MAGQRGSSRVRPAGPPALPGAGVAQEAAGGGAEAPAGGRGGRRGRRAVQHHGQGSPPLPAPSGRPPPPRRGCFLSRGEGAVARPPRAARARQDGGCHRALPAAAAGAPEPGQPPPLPPRLLAGALRCAREPFCTYPAKIAPKDQTNPNPPKTKITHTHTKKPQSLKIKARNTPSARLQFSPRCWGSACTERIEARAPSRARHCRKGATGKKK